MGIGRKPHFLCGLTNGPDTPVVFTGRGRTHRPNKHAGLRQRRLGDVLHCEPVHHAGRLQADRQGGNLLFWCVVTMHGIQHPEQGCQCRPCMSHGVRGMLLSSCRIA